MRYQHRKLDLPLSEGFASLAGLFVALFLCLLIYWFFFRSAAPADPSLSNLNRSFEETQIPNPVDTSSQISVYQSLLGKVQSIEDQNLKRGDDLMKEIEGLDQGAYSGFGAQ